MMPPTVRFWTPAPADAPEVRGAACYFKPEQLQWVVQPGQTFVHAHGPATRVKNREGARSWTVAGPSGADHPDWLPIPTQLLHEASAAVDTLARELEVAW